MSDDWRMRVELMDIYCNMSNEGRLALVSAARGMEKAFKKSATRTPKHGARGRG